MGDLAGREHDPDGAGRFEMADKIAEIVARGGTLAGEAVHRVGALVVDDAVVSGAHQPPHDVAAHPAEADHPELHDAPFRRK